ncbi:MAG: MBL fold metallo-hydrolase [Epsilonproteobacteria bacterium]|nr:MAG: MBL fold metallo-hydrolase [Campylobacterota bacterium]RLA65307.1 MAG: MBL fold metallo-hydrolase [Campylobacterota bacterium]
MEVKTFFDSVTFTLTYIVYDSKTKDGVIIDSVLNYDPNSGKITTKSVDEAMEFINSEDIKIHYILDSHAHADHLTGSQKLKEKIPNAKTGIGANITKVQELFKGFFNLKDLKTDGSQFDMLLEDDQELQAGSVKIKVLNTPGHTPACLSFLIEDMVFVGDAIFMPDFGTGRCDFPAGSAEDLYESVTKKLYTLPDETQVFVGHDYMTGGRGLKYMSTIVDEKTENIQLKANTSKEDFINFRTTRDKKLAQPRLLLPSIQVNILAGKKPEAEDNGVSYLKLPITE